MLATDTSTTNNIMKLHTQLLARADKKVFEIDTARKETPADANRSTTLRTTPETKGHDSIGGTAEEEK